jgi:Flp pilus assembly protein TadD
MGTTAGRIFFAAAFCLVGLHGCVTSPRIADEAETTPELSETPAPVAASTADITGSVRGSPSEREADAAARRSGKKTPNDELSLGKAYFRAADFRLAQRHFRRATELQPQEVEAWIGLAACYDRLRHFGLADHAYDEAVKIAGASPEILNNIGYSLMLRGHYQRARETLLQAQAQDPGNPYIKNNLDLLEASSRKATR